MRSTARQSWLGWVVAPLLLACGAPKPTQTAALEVTPRTLYPLSSGNAWSYDVDTGDGQSVLAITRVEGQSGGVWRVRTGEQQVLYELRDDGIYRPEREGYLLRLPIAAGARWSSGVGSEAEITRTELTIDSAAGRFEGCVEVREQARSGARIETTYCPGVGPVRVVSEMSLSRGLARVVAQLRGYQVGAAE